MLSRCCVAGRINHGLGRKRTWRIDGVWGSDDWREETSGWSVTNGCFKNVPQTEQLEKGQVGRKAKGSGTALYQRPVNRLFLQSSGKSCTRGGLSRPATVFGPLDLCDVFDEVMYIAWIGRTYLTPNYPRRYAHLQEDTIQGQ